MTAEWRKLKEEGKECRTKWGGALMTFGGGFWVLYWWVQKHTFEECELLPKISAANQC